MTLTDVIGNLAAGSRRWADRHPTARAMLARSVAATVVEAAERWVDAAVSMKGATAAEGVAAEEAATGPIATLRLLLITAQSLDAIGHDGVPRLHTPPRLLHGPESAFIGIDASPESWIADRVMFAGHTATVRCANPGGLAAFRETWREECRRRPTQHGVAVVLGAGNVTGLGPADVIGQVFEHGRAVLLKLHPVQEPLLPVFQAAFRPLVEADLLAVVTGGADVARDAIAQPSVTHVHLTGGRAAFDQLVWGRPGPPSPSAEPVLRLPMTCELGGVTPWIVVPGRYTATQLRYQADLAAASIINNTSFNCIATKCLITCRTWDQRREFLDLVAHRLSITPPRPAWYPGSASAWESATAGDAPADGTLPWFFRAGLDAEDSGPFVDREWFAPVAIETPIEASDIEAFASGVIERTQKMPGSLAATVVVPDSLSSRDRPRIDLLVEHLPYGVVAVNTWSALAYALGSVPWGGFPGGTLVEPASGIGFVHDPLMLPLVHNSILRAPLLVPVTPPWFPWHRSGRRLARGVIDVYAAIRRGTSGLWPLLKMLPAVMRG